MSLIDRLPVPDNAKAAVKKGIIHIVSANFMDKVIRFGMSFILVRIMDKDSYGVWSYAINIISFFLLLTGAGTHTGIMQFCSAHAGTPLAKAYLRFGMVFGAKVNLLLAVGLVLVGLFAPLSIAGSGAILASMAFLPLVHHLFEASTMFLRAELQNKSFSQLIIGSSSLYAIGTVVGAFLYSYYGIVAGRYLSYIFSLIFAYSLIKKFISHRSSSPALTKTVKLDFLKFSVTACLTNTVSSVLYLLGTFQVGQYIKDPLVVASYRTATLLPFALNFLPQSVIMFLYPYMVKRAGNKPQLRALLLQVQKHLLLLNLFISSILVGFAPLIIRLLFGAQYADAVVPFRILGVGYFITGTLRVPAGNTIAALKKVKINLYMAIGSGITNIALNMMFIPKWGAAGAAVSTVLVFTIFDSLSNLILYRRLLK